MSPSETNARRSAEMQIALREAQQMQSHLSLLISLTPSGPARNKLTDANIRMMLVEKELMEALTEMQRGEANDNSS